MGIRPNQLASITGTATCAAPVDATSTASVGRRGTQRVWLQPCVAKVCKGAGMAHPILIQRAAGPLPGSHHALQSKYIRQAEKGAGGSISWGSI